MSQMRGFWNNVVGPAPAADAPAADAPAADAPAADAPAADAPAADAPAADAPAADAPPPAPQPWEELAPLCDKYLTDHHFKAVKGEEIVPGDMVCDMYLDNQLLELRATTGHGQAEVCAALVAAFPGLQNYPIQLGHLVADRWDLELKQALVLSGSLPTQPLPIKSAPDGVLQRKADGMIFWQPNLAQGTWGNVKPPTPGAWITDFLDFYYFGPADDSGGATASGCTFNSEATTIDAVIDTMNEQADLADYALDRGTAKGTAQRLCDAGKAAQQKGAQIAQKVQSGADDKAEYDELAKMDMPALLAALDQIRKAGKLDDLVQHANSPLSGPLANRVQVAILTVQLHKTIDEAWKNALKTLSDYHDQDAITHYVYGRIVSGDLDDDPSVRPPAEPGKGGTSPGSSSRVTLYLAYSIVPRTDHTEDPLNKGLSGDKSHDKPGQQLSYTVTLELHPENKSGLELSWTYQATAFRDADGSQTYHFQQIMSGAMVGWVQAFLDGALQLGPIAQVLAGQSRQQVRGSMRFVPTAQASVGAQIQYEIPGTGGHLLIGGQVAAAFTDPSGAAPTGDLTSQISLIWKF